VRLESPRRFGQFLLPPLVVGCGTTRDCPQEPREGHHALVAGFDGEASGVIETLRRMLDHIEAQEAEIADLDARIEEVIAPFAGQVRLLASIPGVDIRSAQTILAEIGPQMSVFPTPGHLASWAGMCPGQRESAGKRGSGKTRKGSKWLRASLIQSARAATRTKNTYLRERYVHLRRRRGDPRAVVAVGHEILLAAYRILDTGQPYIDPGPAPLTARATERGRRRAVSQLQRLGYTVTLDRTTSVA
jgi:transposase